MAKRPTYVPTSSYGAFQATRSKGKGYAGGRKPPAWAAGTGWGQSEPWGAGTTTLDTPGGPSWGSIGNQGMVFDFPYAEDVPNVNNPAGGGPAPFLDIAGYMPDYLSNIGSDPEYLAALADIGEADRMSEAATAEGINQLAVGFGGDLSSLLQQGLINQATANAASANEFSTMKELGRALTRGNEGASNQLASMGTLRSGALDVMRSRLQEGYQRSSTQATNDLLNSVRGLRNSLAQGKAERRSALQNVRTNIASRLMQMQMAQSRPGTRARWNPDVGAYEAMDGSGRFYDQSGNPYWG